MRHSLFVLYFLGFIAVYTLINAYIFIHGYRMAEVFHIPLFWYTTIFLFLSIAYIVGELIQYRWSSVFSDGLIALGSLWFVGIVHFFFASLGYDLFRGINHFFGWFDARSLLRIASALTIVVVIGTVLTLIIGHLNAISPVVRHLKITLPKSNTSTQKLTLAVASDIHLGPINGPRHADRVIKLLNGLNPDMILLPGDILDGEVDPVIRRDLGSHLRQLRATYGVYAIMGNHEYIGGPDRAATYLQDHGIRLLRDEVVEVAGIDLIGRDDFSVSRFGVTRKSLDALLTERDPDRARVLLDHQPRHLEDAQSHAIDLQLSGHTHNGQLWPLNHIVNSIFEIGRGYRRIGGTHFVVSSGVGTWGPPVRTNSRAEVWLIELEFNG